MAIYKYQFTAKELPTTLATLNSNGRLNRQTWNHESFDRTFAHDLTRIPLVYFGDNEAQIHERLKNTDNFSNEDATEFDYLQSDLQGGLATQLALDKKIYYGNNNAVNFVYLNNKNVLCNFDLTYVKDETNQSHLIIAITENINSALDNRIITLFIDDFYFPEDSETLKNQGKPESAETIFTSIAENLKSAEVSKLIKPIINENLFNEESFKQLKNRIKAGKNIDDKKHKIKQLQELIELAMLIDNDVLQDNASNPIISEINQDIKGNTRFKEANFEKLILNRSIQLEERINTLHDNPKKRKQLKQLNALLYTRHQLERQLRHGSENPDYIEAKIACIEEQFNEIKNIQIPVEAAPGEKSFKELKATYSQPFAKRYKGSLILGSLSATGALALGITGAVLLATGVLAPFGLPLLIGAAVFAALTLVSGGSFVYTFVKETKLVADLNRYKVNAKTFENYTVDRVNQMIPEKTIQDKMIELEAQKPVQGFKVSLPLPEPKQDARNHELLNGFTNAAIEMSERALTFDAGLDSDNEHHVTKIKERPQGNDEYILSPVDPINP